MIKSLFGSAYLFTKSTYRLTKRRLKEINKTECYMYKAMKECVN